jgi:hypothetical protein
MQVEGETEPAALLGADEKSIGDSEEENQMMLRTAFAAIAAEQ